MTDLLPVESDVASLELDPVAYMATVLHRAKSWLDEAQNIDDVRNAKAIAIGYENVIREKEMAFDAQLAATEIVRRCERRVGELVRRGQADGTVARNHIGVVDGNTKTVTAAAGVNHRSQVAPLVALADAPRSDFDAAIESAKAEGNLSRANVVRKVKGETKPEGRSEWHYKKHHIDSNRIVERLAIELDAATTGLDLIDPSTLDEHLRVSSMESIRKSIQTIQKEMRRW